ncbi:hypothetical protein DY138_02380 [Apilactobacillus timberlakei]|uniref:hypothetical protein n=1 Tax=Apilactobacillus timberlakei TaxID=2008380 RepID=UPI001129B16E|nr:hypothetical protein [Apilactobacillus timberlakei]TPR19511.1 hypothetical protein DY138_02380 [Apilactobacillus timberlakei]TPR20488.1 hypothetical protein DY061_04020 [Apilactobacillus timberlakei]TPR22532.1 hypothetical protein DY083_03290 [Apilactobacillus timberlakei]
MNRKRCSKKEFLSIIDGKGHDSYAHVSSFAIYPNSICINDTNVKKEFLAEMNKDYIYEDQDNKVYSKRFLENIHLSDFALIGLNSADFKEKSNKCSFQTMHLTSNDSVITRMIEKVTNKDLVKGCFMFDIINNVTATKLPIISKVITILQNKPEHAFNVNETNFDLESIKNIDLSNCNYLYNHRNDDYDSNNQYLECVNKLAQHIIEYDIPAFIYIMSLIRPKFLICFGNSSKRLTEILVNKCKIRGNSIKSKFGIVDVRQVLHYSYYGKNGTFEKKCISFNNAINK